jgi:hypothetical protein
MTKKTWGLVILGLLLATTYAWWFTDWINVPRIEIIKSDRPTRTPRPGQTVNPVAFSFDGHYRLTSVKVIRSAEADSKRNPQPLWHLRSSQGSEPTKGIIYGRPVPGMVQANTNERPARLQPATLYRLLIEAGRARGEVEFQPSLVEAGSP